MRQKFLTAIGFFLIFFIISNFIEGAIPAQERTALIALYNSTHGGQWTDNSGWKTPPLYSDGFAMPGTEGGWRGILEIINDHVTKIHLAANNLCGSIPSELGNLNNLQSLNLSSYGYFYGINKLTGSIPPTFGNLSNLKELVLYGNELSGSIPPGLGNLGNLEKLNLVSNQLSGSIPAELGNLKNLEILALSSNPLSGNIPHQLGNLTRLKELILGNQHTGNIPPQLGNLSNLERLDLESNQLSGNIPPELGNLVNLEVLNLSKNQLSGSIPSQLGNLNNLLDLRLDKNQLSQNIPSQLGNLSNLKYLNLSNNQLSGSIPSQLGNLQKLSILELSGNQLSGNIPHELGKLYYLDWLFLNSNRLTGSIPPELGKIGWVSKLSLDNNQLSGSIPPELGNLSMLIYLHLENNLLSGSIPSSLGRMRNLWFLYLNNNQLDGNIPPSLGTGHLHGIYLNHNQLSGNIPPELGNFWNWGEIYLNNNRLNGDIPSSLTNLVNIAQFDIGYNCLHASDKDLRAWLDIHDPDWEIHQDQCGGTQPIISLNRSRLYFCALTPAYQTFTGSQEVWISNSGLESLNWNIHTDSSWLTCTPLSGIDSGIITISVNPAGLSEGTYSGTITISDSHAANAPQYISVTLKIKPNSEEMLPFGAFLTPVDNSNVCSSIPVTGWVLDDIGIQSVKIYREEGTLLHFIGNAEFMDSARPDIEMAYLDYPFNYKAGWGYMMLTNSLPDGGNGVFKLHALATDVNGNIVNLGVKTITVDNANAVKPFGYIDSPVQCGVTSGKNVINWGWVLTPRPRYIPTDGSTISVWVDGVSIGHPTYNLYREDIAGKFPGYANSNGAVGYFYLDTTAFQNGIHTLFWTAVDNAGNTDGIGSRYFTILNRKQHSSFSASHNSCPGLNEELPGLFPGFHPLLVKTGYNNEVNPREIYPDEEGFSHILCRELERIEITMKDPGTPSSCFNGYLVVGEKLRPLPTGSTLDAGKGVFYWQPGPGFIGTYHLAFVEKDETGMINRKEVIVEIEPKYPVMENYVQKKVKYNQGSE